MSKLVFIVDDEQSIAKLLSFWVKDKWGYEVEIFSNSESMLKKFSSKPDIILLAEWNIKPVYPRHWMIADIVMTMKTPAGCQ